MSANDYLNRHESRAMFFFGVVAFFFTLVFSSISVVWGIFLAADPEHLKGALVRPECFILLFTLVSVMVFFAVMCISQLAVMGQFRVYRRSV